MELPIFLICQICIYSDCIFLKRL
uniref:Uncharacterized protein n=1 Tax=Arundo donax TaxID=35708 RepID=A0A0A9BKN1_ARUDO